MVTRLLDLRLLQVVDVEGHAGGSTPRLMRIHRLVHGVVSARGEAQAQRQAVAEHAEVRAAAVASRWWESGRWWELGPLRAVALDTMERDATAGARMAHNVAYAHAKAGRHVDAESLCRRALAVCEHTLGTEHRLTLIALHDLGDLLRARGDDYWGAHSLLARAFVGSLQASGIDSPDTLPIANSFALLYVQQGEYESAEEHCELALRGCERVLGRTHPDTLASVTNRALLYERKGDLAGAEPLYRHVLEACERAEDDHPDTFGAMRSLARVLLSRGNHGGAELLYRRALEGSERLLGPDHPDTLAGADGLAGLLSTMDGYQDAESLYRRVLETRARVLGPEHRDTLNSMEGFAVLLESTGRHERAEGLCRQILEIRERVNGLDGFETLRTVNQLARLVERNGGDDAGAEPLYRRALEALERIHGPFDSLTSTVSCNLAALLTRQERVKEASDIRRHFWTHLAARALHDFYRALCQVNGWPVHYDYPLHHSAAAHYRSWDYAYSDLPGKIQAQNIAAAARVPRVLATAGLTLLPNDGTEALDDAEMRALVETRLDRLTEAEHAGWIEHQISNGWTLGWILRHAWCRRVARLVRVGPAAVLPFGRRNAERRISGLLVPYAELPDEEQEKVRDRVRHYPDIAALAELTLAAADGKDVDVARSANSPSMVLARALHRHHRALCRANDWGVAVVDEEYELQPWAIQAENAAMAERMPHVLAAAGLVLVRRSHASALDEAAARALLEQDLERLADVEHSGWTEHRLRHGHHQLLRDGGDEIFPALLGRYAELPDDEKEKVRNNIRAYPSIADLATMALARQGD